VIPMEGAALSAPGRGGWVNQHCYAIDFIQPTAPGADGAAPSTLPSKGCK